MPNSKVRQIATRWAAITLLVASACQPQRQLGEEVPPPPPGADPIGDPSQRQAILDYARGLDFDSVIHGASDRQPLTFIAPPNGVRLGPVATILPERRTHNNRLQSLNQGRIVARIESQAPYPPLGMPAGISYVWIDQLDSLSVRECRDEATTYFNAWLDSLEALAGRNLMQAVVDSMQAFRQQRQSDMGRDVLPCNGVARAVIIPDDTETPAQVRRVFFRLNDQARHGFALARWIFSDDNGWVSCVELGCCVIMGGPFL